MPVSAAFSVVASESLAVTVSSESDPGSAPQAAEKIFFLTRKSHLRRCRSLGRDSQVDTDLILVNTELTLNLKGFALDCPAGHRDGGGRQH